MELKAIITYLKSLKFRIFLLIILFGIAPTFLLRAGILSAYEKRAVDTRTVDITSQAKLLATQIVANNYLQDTSSKNITTQLDQLSTIYDGRVMLIDSSFTIVKDTYALDEQKTILAEEVMQAYNGETVQKYDADNRYIEMTLPMYDESGKNVIGVMLVSVSTVSYTHLKELLQEALSANVKDTFNMISVDGDTSTNDTLLLMANGLAGNPEITEKDADYDAFCEALNFVNTTLAKMMAGDGEGATALFEVTVVNAETKEQAQVLAKSVICSSLTKAAIFGHDANWGRILCAMGYSGATFDPDKVDLYFESKGGKIKLIENGVALDYSEEEATKILSEPEVTAIADLKLGDAQGTAWGCDLSYDYVKINADYRS